MYRSCALPHNTVDTKTGRGLFPWCFHGWHHAARVPYITSSLTTLIPNQQVKFSGNLFLENFFYCILAMPIQL